MLIDTCVWLDIAKDPQQQSVIGILEELVRQEQVSLIVPSIVKDEFARNKERIIKDGQRSLSSVLKRAKEMVDQLGDAKRKRLVLEQLDEVDYKLPSLPGVTSRAVITLEHSDLHCVDDVSLTRHNRKVPDVCQTLDVQSCGPFTLNRDSSTGWKANS